ncbi:Interferon-induced helicase C domain-containing protein 1 [Geodia barretti]|uniref:RNA helicase n=1 Tax=Geodia barretti TaxID=519541 RepID=A0AA35WNW2_GEOBA|nr:Interferon-induced helicase C domain-containing protein 1 [Geodia barretti]
MASSKDDLRVDDLYEIQEAIWDARPKWRNIGLGLKIRPPDIEVIDVNNGNVDDKFHGMILKWLQNGKNCTWGALCEVLSLRSVGHDNLAAEIKRKKCVDPSGPLPQGNVPDAGNQSLPTTLHSEAACPTTPSVPLDNPSHDHQGGNETKHFVGTNNTIVNSQQKLAVVPKAALCGPEIHETPSSFRENETESQDRLADPGFQGNRKGHVTQAACASPTQTTPLLAVPNSTVAQTEFIPPSEFASSVSETNTPMPIATLHHKPFSNPEAAFSKELSLHSGIRLRGYQEELAGPGLHGENYIFVAPTGTGKTLVAGYIIMHHLNKMLKEGRRRKVAFVTPTRQLTFQQKTKLQEYIPGMRVVEITGASCQPMHPLVQGDEVDVIVCTAGKLRRELKTKAIEITDFSLIVADECHHAGRHSNYSDIMEFYIRSKLAKPASTLPPHFGDTPLPQIVGLTASPGAGRGKSNIVTVIEHQLSLCASMDATSGIVTVQRNAAELEKYRNSPRKYLEVGDERSPNDPFILYVNSAMETLEHYVGNNPCLARGSSGYDTWLQNEKEAAENREEDERKRISVLDRLSVYSQCLMTYSDFRHEDAVSVLEEVEEFRDQTDFEHFLFGVHTDLMEKLSRLPKTPNPLLEHMETILRDQFARCPQSKGIFFVRSIKHTRYVTNWIKSSPTLSPTIQATHITGYNRAGGMEKSEQLRVLEGFRQGKYNLLASTSVLEEGLDVPECNFVVRYQNVSNEIAQVQAKGRARAQDSRMYTVVSTNSNKDYWYLVAEEKQRLVEASLATLKDQPLKDVIPSKQKSFIQERDRKALQLQSLRSKWPDTEKVEVHCKKCNVLACRGSDVFAYTLSGHDNPHHVVPSKAFSNMYDKKEHNKPDVSYDFVKPYRIYCRLPNCRSQWGVIAVWGDTGYKFPVLKCGSFLFKYGESTKKFKKWKVIWFEVKSIQDWAEFEDDVTQNP